VTEEVVFHKCSECAGRSVMDISHCVVVMCAMTSNVSITKCSVAW